MTVNKDLFGKINVKIYPAAMPPDNSAPVQQTTAEPNLIYGEEKFTLIFYILESFNCNKKLSYGIQIEKMNNDESCILKSESIYDITNSKQKIGEMARALFDDLF